MKNIDRRSFLSVSTGSLAAAALVGGRFREVLAQSNPGGNLVEINAPVGDLTSDDIPELKPLAELEPQGPEQAGARLYL